MNTPSVMSCQNDIRIVKVEKGTALSQDLLRFVETCSWDEVKEHVSWMIRTWVFKDWETMVVALAEDKIVGMASLMKTDYYPLPEFYPWISTIFVSEDYRGHRISEKVIAYANQIAKSCGFERTYIPSSFMGLYEKYGYHYVKDIVNYGHGVDHLFEKELA